MEVRWRSTGMSHVPSHYLIKKKPQKPKKQLIRHGREEGRVVLLLLIPSHKIFGFLSEKELMFAK